MPTFTIGQRLKIALGGFICFAGALIVASVFLTETGAANLESIFQTGPMVAVVAFVGVLDVVCGLILLLRDRMPLFASHQKKTDDDVN